MPTSDPRHQSRWLLGLPPLIVEDPSSPSELDYPSLGNRSLRSNTESVWTSHDSRLLEYSFTEVFIPPYNPSIMNPLGPLLIQVEFVPPMSFVGPIHTIPSTANRSWSFVDTFGPLPPPKSTVNTTPLMDNPSIPTVPCSNPIVTPNLSGT